MSGLGMWLSGGVTCSSMHQALNSFPITKKKPKKQNKKKWVKKRIVALFVFRVLTKELCLSLRKLQSKSEFFQEAVLNTTQECSCVGNSLFSSSWETVFEQLIVFYTKPQACVKLKALVCTVLGLQRRVRIEIPVAQGRWSSLVLFYLYLHD